MPAQAYTNLSGNQGGNTNEPTSFVATDGFVGAPTSPLNPNNPTFTAATFPYGAVIPSGSTIHGASSTASLSLPVTAVASTAFTLSLPTGAIIQSATVYTTTAYTGTGVTIALGSAASGAQYVAATSIKAQGVVTLAFVTTGAAGLLSLPAGTPNLFITVAQSGTPTNVGAATLVISYTLP